MSKLEQFYKFQNDTYSGKYGSILNSIAFVNSRIFKECFLITCLLEEFNLLEKNDFKKKLDVLEPGCGIGLFSKYIGNFAKNLYSFDISNEGIQKAKIINCDLKNINHFLGDGIYPEKIEEIKNKKFDFIFFREFHPFSMDFFNDPNKSIRILDKYVKFLKKEGIIIIHHAESKTINSMRFNDLRKKFKNSLIGIYSPQILLISLLIFRYNFKIASKVSSILSSIIFIFFKTPLKYSVLKISNN